MNTPDWPGWQLERTCHIMPVSIEGIDPEGRHVYLRARHGWYSVGIGATIDEAVEDVMSTEKEDVTGGYDDTDHAWRIFHELYLQRIALG